MRQHGADIGEHEPRPTIRPRFAAGLEAGAIFSGERWVLKAQRGLHFLAPDVVEVVKAWRP